MKSKDDAERIFDLLREKFIAIIRLLNNVINLDELDIYVSINNGAFVSCVNASDDISETKLLNSLAYSSCSYQKEVGDFIIYIIYRKSDKLSPETLEMINSISSGLIDLIEKEVIDIQRRVEEEKKVEELKIKSQHDGLTGLYNRETFDLIYSQLYQTAKNGQQDFSVLMIDIDDFKVVNDCHGHQFGDKVLKEVAVKIKLNLRKKDVVARYGGEEIIVILMDIDKVEAQRIAERIRSSVATINLQSVAVTISIGIANFRRDVSTTEAGLLYIADKCLYKAKSLGKNRIAYRQE